MRVLIPTYPQDVHAAEIALALEDQGHEAVLWCGGDFPTRQSAAIEIRDGGISLEMAGPDLEGGRPPFDVVWLRRPTPAVLPSDLHPGDLPVARRECRDFLAGLYHLVAPDAFWVNPLQSHARSELKMVQLQEAVRAGLNVPPTLLSNDPDRIRRFLDAFPGRAVYKPFHPAQWENDDRTAVLLTSEVSADDLPEDEILRLTPGIFQARIDKAHELRATFMGDHLVTARLRSQEVEAARLDWRAAGGRIGVEPDRLPDEVERACRQVMHGLGILYGAFDFIVTPEGEHVFLEVNPAGQFLWVEEVCPELPMLAPFVDFLLARDPRFRWRPAEGSIRHVDYYPRAVERLRDFAPRHVEPDSVFSSSDLPQTKA
jgi:hypothetical protein